MCRPSLASRTRVPDLELHRLSNLPALGNAYHSPPGPFVVHLWRHEHRGDLDALLPVLSADEHLRLAGLRDDRRREQFVRGRALCRHVLSSYAPVRPQDWRFTLGGRGKPVIAGPPGSAPLWFNLSHTDGTSMCAVTGAGPDIGIDVEQIARGDNALDVAEQFYSAAEVNALHMLPASERGEAFMRLWALKESLAKAGESSLAEVLARTAFDISQPDAVSVSFSASLTPARHWHFTLTQIDHARIAALAVRTNSLGVISVQAGEANWF